MTSRARAAADVAHNRILAALPAATTERLLAHLEPVSLEIRQVISEAREATRHVYFPVGAVLSLVTPLADRSAVEVATVGNEGLVGLAAFLKTGWMPYRVFVQVPGRALRVDAETIASEAARDEALSDVCKRYTQALLTQIAQSTACNRLHPVEERCARWLLMTHDRVDYAAQFPMTQEFLAQMLGVRRATVTVAAGTLQRAGLIRYTRGKITVVDRRGLEAASCECYHAVRTEIDRLLGPPVRAVGAELASLAAAS